MPVKALRGPRALGFRVCPGLRVLGFRLEGFRGLGFMGLGV